MNDVVGSRYRHDATHKFDLRIPRDPCHDAHAPGDVGVTCA